MPCDHSLPQAVSPKARDSDRKQRLSEVAGFYRSLAHIIPGIPKGYKANGSGVAVTPAERWRGVPRNAERWRIVSPTQPCRAQFGRREDDRHAVMDLGDQIVRIGCDDGKCPNPFARSGFFPVLQMPAMPNGAPSFMAIAAASPSDLIAFHSKKPSTGTMQRRLRYASPNVGMGSLKLGADRFSAAVRITAPITDQTPPERS